jgi:hypothetical protein
MGARKRTARQLQLEAMERRWTPGGCPGGVLGDRLSSCHIGEKIPQAPAAHVVPLATCGSNTIRGGQEGNALSGIVSPLQKVREA